eukprot:835508-Rhodomonas_salina.1
MFPGESIRNQGQLNSANAWVSATNLPGSEYMEFDLGVPTVVAGVATKGRADLDRWVTNFFVTYSLDRSTWTDVQNGDIFQGNTNSYSLLQTIFAALFETRYIRIYPVSSYLDTVFQMRAGVILQLGCENVDECAEGVDDCDANAECVDTVGAF